MFVKYLKLLYILSFTYTAYGKSESKWLSIKPVHKNIKSGPENQVGKWLSNRSKSIFNDRENIKLVKSNLDATLKANPIDNLSYDVLGQEAHFGQQKLMNDFTKSFMEREVGKITLLKAFRGGFNFNFGGKEARSVPQPSTNQADPIYYGLVVKDIKPSKSQKLMVALPTENVADYSHAPKAEVVWNIEKQYKQSNLTPYRVSTGIATYAPPPSLWQKVTDTNFSGNIKPEKFDPAAGGAQKLSIPKQVLSLNQSSGFYSLQLTTTNDLAPESSLHVFHVKLAGTTYRNELDMDFKIQKSSLLGIVSDGGHFSANVHHFHESKRFQSELNYRSGSQVWSLRSDTESIDLEKLDHESNKIELTISQNF